MSYNKEFFKNEYVRRAYGDFAEHSHILGDIDRDYLDIACVILGEPYAKIANEFIARYKEETDTLEKIKADAAEGIRDRLNGDYCQNHLIIEFVEELIDRAVAVTERDHE